jgi:hypothetical protein
MPENGLIRFATLPHGMVIADRDSFTWKLTRVVGTTGEDFIVEQTGCARYFRHRVTERTFHMLEQKLAALPQTSECGCR